MITPIQEVAKLLASDQPERKERERRFGQTLDSASRNRSR